LRDVSVRKYGNRARAKALSITEKVWAIAYALKGVQGAERGGYLLQKKSDLKGRERHKSGVEKG